MLSIQKISLSAEDAAKYYTEKFGKEDYYLKGQEPPGEWHGAEKLGLSGEVKSVDLEALFNGKSPDGQQLVKLTTQENRHSPGWDFTFSAPKSVSLVFVRADGELREKLLTAHNRAVDAALSHMERVVLRESVRRVSMELGIRSVSREAPKNIITARFQHRTSRDLDPQLHTHCLVMNMAERQDGRWGGIDVKQAYKEKKAIGAIYRAELASILQKELGFRVERDREFFRLKYVPKELEKTFSKRREQILESMKERGWSGGRLAKEATLLTREKKRLVDNDAMLEIWKIQCDKLGWDQGKFEEKFKEEDKSHLYEIWKDKTADFTRESIAEKAFKEITAGFSTFTLEGLKAKFCEHAQGILDAREIEAEFSKYQSFKGLVNLGLDEFGRTIFTTAEIQKVETRMLETAQILDANLSHGIDGKKQVEAILDFEKKQESKDFKFSSDQIDGILHALSPGQIKLIEGAAGSGKSLSMELVREVFEKEGFRVRGLCPTGKAAQNLKESGIDTVTFDKYFLDKINGRDQLTSRDIVVCDEMGMVGSKKMARLLDEISRSGAKLISVGEYRQLQPIDAGGAFRTLGKALGNASISKIFRQEENWQREAVSHFREGQAEKGLLLFQQRGLLCLKAKHQEVNIELVKDYVVHRLEKPGESSLVLARTNAEVASLNQSIRESLKEKGLIEGTDFTALVRVQKQPQTRSFAVGDRVVFLKNNKKLGVQNGLLGTITAITPDMRGQARILLVKDDKGQDKKIDLFSYDQIDHSYAVTVYKSQGSTIDRVFVRATPNMGRETSYVALSRQKIQASIYATHEEFGDSVKKLDPLINLYSNEVREKLLTEKSLAGMAKIMSKSNQKNTSADYRNSPEEAGPLVTRSLKKLAGELKAEYTASQLALLRSIALAPAGITKKEQDPGLETPWRTKALEILSKGEFDKISELKSEISTYAVGSEPPMTDKLGRQVSFWERDVDSIFIRQQQLLRDYQTEYTTPKVMEAAKALEKALSADERIAALSVIASSPRGMGSQKQLRWNNSPAPYQLRAREMLKNGVLGQSRGAEFGQHIQTIPAGREPSLDPDGMKAISDLVAKRAAIVKEEAVKGKEVFRGQGQSL